MVRCFTRNHLLGRRNLASTYENILFKPPGVLFEGITFAVKPEQEDIAIVCQQFLNLTAFIIHK